MCTIIQPLPSHVQSKLRSFVTITSPLQVVQELVLNSVDAEATSIAVRVDFKIFRFQVVDNGFGISKRNLSVVGERYATSKFNPAPNSSDLPQSNYGYRGEALASLVDVAGYLEVTSRCLSCPIEQNAHREHVTEIHCSNSQEELGHRSFDEAVQDTIKGKDDAQHLQKELTSDGTKYKKSTLLASPHSEEDNASDLKLRSCKTTVSVNKTPDTESSISTGGLEEWNNTFVKVFSFGKGSDVQQASHQRPCPGTTVTVQDFMYCVPIRRKMIKEAVDLENIRLWLEGMVLIHPHVAFSLRNDKSSGPLLLQSKKCVTMMGAVRQMFGDDLADSLAEVHHSIGPVTVTGYISTQACPSKSLQFVCINKRLILKTQIHKFMNKLLGKSSVVNTKRSVYYYNKNSKCNRSPSSPPKGVKLYGVFILNIACPNQECDILLDPTRTLVEFRNWSRIFSCLEEAVIKFGKEENIAISLEDSCRPADNTTSDSEMKAVQTDKNIEKELPIVIRSQEKLKIFCHKRKNSSNSSAEPLMKKYGKFIGISDVSNAIQGRVVRRPKTKSADPVIVCRDSITVTESSVSSQFPGNAITVTNSDTTLTSDDHISSVGVTFRSSLEQFKEEVQQVSKPSNAFISKPIARHKSTASCTRREHQGSNKRVVRAAKDHQMSSSSESSDDETKDNVTLDIDENVNREKLDQPCIKKTIQEIGKGRSFVCAGSSTISGGSSIQEFCLLYKKDVDERIDLDLSTPIQSTLESPTLSPPVNVKGLSDSIDITDESSHLVSRPVLEMKPCGTTQNKIGGFVLSSAVDVPVSVANKRLKVSHPCAGRRTKIVDIRVPLGQLFNKTLSSALKENFRKEQTRLKTSSTLENFRFKSKSSDEDPKVDCKDTAHRNYLKTSSHSVHSASSSGNDHENSFYFNPVILESKPSHISMGTIKLDKSVHEDDNNLRVKNLSGNVIRPLVNKIPSAEDPKTSKCRDDKAPGNERMPVHMTSLSDEVSSVAKLRGDATVPVGNVTTNVVPQVSPSRKIYINQPSVPEGYDQKDNVSAGSVLRKNIPTDSELQSNTFDEFSCITNALNRQPISIRNEEFLQCSSGKAETIQQNSSAPQANCRNNCSSNLDVVDASFSSHRCQELHHQGDTQLSRGNDSLYYDSHPCNARHQESGLVGRYDTVTKICEIAPKSSLSIKFKNVSPLVAATNVISNLSTPGTGSSASFKTHQDIKTISEHTSGSSNLEVNNNDCSDKGVQPIAVHGPVDNARLASHHTSCSDNVAMVSGTKTLSPPKEILWTRYASLSVTPLMVFFEMNLGVSNTDVLASNSDFSTEYLMPSKCLPCQESKWDITEKLSISDSNQCLSSASTNQVFDSGSSSPELVSVSKATSSTPDNYVTGTEDEKDPSLQGRTVFQVEKVDCLPSNCFYEQNYVKGSGKSVSEKSSLKTSCSQVVVTAESDQLSPSSCNAPKCDLPSLVPLEGSSSSNEITNPPTLYEISDLHDIDTAVRDHSSPKMASQPSGNVMSQTQVSRASSSLDSMWLTQQSRLAASSKTCSDVIRGTISLSLEEDSKGAQVSGPSKPTCIVSNTPDNLPSFLFDGNALKLGEENAICSQQTHLENNVSANTCTLAGKLNAKMKSKEMSINFNSPTETMALGVSVTENEIKGNSCNAVYSSMPASLKNLVGEWKEAKGLHGQTVYINLRSGNSSYVPYQSTFPSAPNYLAEECPSTELVIAPVQTIPFTSEPGSIFRDSWIKSSSSCIPKEFSTLGRERLSLSNKLALRKNMARSSGAPPSPAPVVLYDDEMRSVPDTVDSVGREDCDDGCCWKTGTAADEASMASRLGVAIDKFNRETDAMSSDSAFEVPITDNHSIRSKNCKPNVVNSKQFTTNNTKNTTEVSRKIAEVSSYSKNACKLLPVKDALKVSSNPNTRPKETLVNSEASKNAEQTVREICSQACISSVAMEPAVLKLDDPWTEAVGPKTCKDVCGEEENAYKFTKDMLQTCTVLGQLDRKFIVCTLEYTRNLSKVPESMEIIEKKSKGSNYCQGDQTTQSSPITTTLSNPPLLGSSLDFADSASLSNTSGAASKGSLSPTIPLLVVFDQHAVHERIRLEAILESNYTETSDPCCTSTPTSASRVQARKVLKSWPVTPSIELNFSESDIRIMEEYRADIENFGLVFEKMSCDSCTIRFTRLPVCLFPRSVVTDALAKGAIEDTCPPEDQLGALRGEGEAQNVKVAANPAQQAAVERPLDKSANTAELFKDPSSQFTRRWRRYRGRLVLTVVQQMCDVIRRTRTPPYTLPQPLLDTLHTQACRGAIKFGQRLSVAQCRSLLAALSRCALPFQCAHGRPSLVPLCDLTSVAGRGGNTLSQAPNLKKLREMMLQNPSP